MNRDDRIYIAGHRGMVGSALLRSLEAKGYTRLVVRTRQELDLLDAMAVDRFFAEEQPSYVFLAAARVGGILANNTFRAEFLYENLMIQTHVIHAAWKHGVKKLLFLGSSCIYPRSAPQPLKEEYLLSGSLEPTNEPYAVAKIAGIKMCESYHRQYGSDFVSVMPTNLYGPGDNFDLATSHVLPAMLRKMHLAACLEKEDYTAVHKDLQLAEKEDRENILEALKPLGIEEEKPGKVLLTLWGSGSPRREFLHVDDMAEACVFIMEHLYAATILERGISHLNIGTGSDLPISDLATLLARVTGFRGIIGWDRDKPDGMPRKLLDVSRLENAGWKARISLEEGIKQVYAYYLKRNRL